MRSLLPWRSPRTSAEPSSSMALLDQLWWNPFGESNRWLRTAAEQARVPSINIAENENELVVEAEFPGLTGKDVQLTYHQGVLTIKGSRTDNREEHRGHSYYRESRTGSFRREIPLGRELDWEHARATCTHGLLTVRVPKSVAAQRRIKVDVK